LEKSACGLFSASGFVSGRKRLDFGGLINWKKVACGAFFGQRLRFPPQKAQLLPPAL
jgi:hypothetical protein